MMLEQIMLDNVIVDDLKQKNQENINQLKEQLQKTNKEENRWVFCLGAGVSISCGLPDWTKLLAMISGQLLQSYASPNEKTNEWLKIIGNTIQRIDKDACFFKKLKKSVEGKTMSVYKNIDSLELAEYIKTQIQAILQISDSNNEELIDECLRGYIRDCYNIKWTDDGDIKGYDCATLKAIVEVMEKIGIKRAITYNYDDLVEVYLEKDGKKVMSLVPEERKEFIEEQDTFKIYHCHGLVPTKAKPSYGKIILTESSYYNEEHNSYSLSNALQAYSMNYCNLLYVGFSGADYTFRRIIRGLEKKENGSRSKHRIFFCADDIVDMVYNGLKASSLTEEEFIKGICFKNKKFNYESLLINQIIVSKSVYWEEKGMDVIWSTRKELPQVLKSLCCE